MMKHVNNGAAGRVGDRFALFTGMRGTVVAKRLLSRGKHAKHLRTAAVNPDISFLAPWRGCPTMFRAPMSRGCLETEQNDKNRALYDENPDPPLQFQFCGGDGSLCLP